MLGGMAMRPAQRSVVKRSGERNRMISGRGRDDNSTGKMIYRVDVPEAESVLRMRMWELDGQCGSRLGL